ncbi:tRNA (cytosine(32)/uridine(32)-2'-O)-methyltransferase TrmJ [Idiomarina sp. OT37-5b]|jgi:tRNA (cytidine32/uridine32-2'-O)-methyltransferase|uniref:tRNA (cytidine/uridine-2'-O-)-methyltransferase TrmJ n=1 Tax=Idiomarina aquatica TaxID=1327752 RepID=A0AA94JDX1_9GAMM|nr:MULTISPECIES: tRNA (cytosine(32)/uridine(32)-2'-O)-methyltransferase TrmJ [Idiomarina]AVJ55213.1 tRNA (cytosine(32)/uridine(32)-2'-O)-methyltransferase TrmJ [Idiomarina sp. OT37-5b]RUO45259.1 tRNA (cytosine(32)/uridine(32)-2'-O)-methyltransferase TrmJ [Idiomarina aquatica]
MLDSIRIVLVNTSHTGNIGSVARAMKTMGLKELTLVDPVNKPDSHASALAAGATDILANAQIVDTLEEAIADCELVLATSARNRTLDWPLLGPRDAAAKMLAEAPKHKVAVVFGRENNGLTNEELQLSQYHLHIPTNPDYGSLNLAMAVQTVCYELRMQHLEAAEGQSLYTHTDEIADYPRAEQLEMFYQHLEQTLYHTGFIVKQHPGQVMTKLRRLFNRARPEESEINILRGILASIKK